MTRITLDVEVTAKRRELERLADAFDDAAGKADQLSDEAKKTAVELAALDAEIRKHKDNVRELGREYVKTGDVDVLKNLRSERAAVSNLRRIRKELDGVGDEARQAARRVNDLGDELAKAGGKGFGLEFAQNVGEALTGATGGVFRSLPPEATAAIGVGLVSAVALALPAVGSAIGAAVLGGVGIGGVVGGVVLAAKDPRVQAAWTALGTDVGSRLKEAAEPFKVELVKSASIFGDAFDRIGPSIRKDFATLAPVTSELAKGVGLLIERAMPGVDRAVEAARPFLHELAQEMPKLGDAMSRFLSSIAAAGPGATDFFRALLRFTEATLIGLGKFVEGMSAVFEVFAKASGVLGPALGLTKGKTDELAGAFDNVSANINDYGDAANEAKRQTEDLSRAFDDLFGVQMGMDQAAIGWEKSMRSLSKSIEDNGKSLDIHTEKGTANREAILGAVQAAERYRQAQINAGVASGTADAAYDQQIEQLRALALRMGLTRDEVDQLIAKYKTIPTTVSTTVQMAGLNLAVDDIREYNRYLLSIPKSITTTIGVSSGGTGSSRQRTYAAGGVRHAAGGMLVPPSYPGTVLMGEPQTGGELLLPLRGISQRRAASLLGVGASAYGLGVGAPARAAGGGTRGTQVVLAPGAGGQLDQLLATVIMQMIRTGQIQIG